MHSQVFVSIDQLARQGLISLSEAPDDKDSCFRVSITS